MKADAAFNRRVMRAFEDMLDQPAETRGHWLATVCEDDPPLGDALRAMDEASRSSRLFPTVAPDPVHRAADTHAPPSRIDRYRIIDEIGRGGMGIVYLGERDDGLFEHKVAIKLIRRTLLSERALDRFATERRILARLRHPHIAQIFDGGITPEGDSYAVMELIVGTSITEYCEDHDLGLNARLDLFREVAGAIDHAHRNLIVHADIKPSNVVVEDGFGVKLLDFGIARLLDESADERHDGHTPGYASVARINGNPATPADDIFAAGILLGELIAEQPGVDADLDAVVAKASAPDPEFRYGSIRELVDDLTRWQSRRPVRALPADRRHRAWLFWRRNSLGLSLSAAALSALLIALGLTTVFWLNSERQRALAEQRYAATQRMADYIVGDIDPALARVPGTLALRKQLVERTGAYLRGLEANRNASPALQREIAAGYLRLAKIDGLDPSGGIGDLPAAKASLAHAEELIASAAAREPDAPQLTLLRAQAALLNGSEVYLAPSRAAAETGLASLVKAQLLFESYLRADPDNINARLGLWTAQIMPARSEFYLGRPMAGVAIVERDLSNANMPVATTTERDERDFIVSGSYLLLGEAYGESNPRRALLDFGRLIDHVDQMQKLGQSDWESDLTQNSGFADRASLEVKLGDLAPAARDYAQAIDGLAALYRIEGNHEMGSYLSLIRARYASLESRLGHYDAARLASDGAIQWLRHDVALAPDDGSRLRTLSLALTTRAQLEQRAGGDACTAAKAAVKQWDSVVRIRAAMPTDLTSGVDAAVARDIASRSCRS